MHITKISIKFPLLLLLFLLLLLLLLLLLYYYIITMNVYAGWYTSAPVPTKNFLKIIKTAR